MAAEAFIALLDGLGIQTCVVMAISGGGPTGLALAAFHPARVTRLVMIEAISQPEVRANQPSYNSQVDFYGPTHSDDLVYAAIGKPHVAAEYGPADDGDLLHP